MGDAEEQEWDCGRRQAAGGVRSQPQTPSPRGQSLEGQAAEDKGQPRGGEPAPAPVPRGAAAGLSTKVRLNRHMALVPQAATAMGIVGPEQSFFSIDPSRAGRRPVGRGRLFLHPTRPVAGWPRPPGGRGQPRPPASLLPACHPFTTCAFLQVFPLSPDPMGSCQSPVDSEKLALPPGARIFPSPNWSR